MPVTHCTGVDRCLCHGLFEVRLDARTWPYGDTVLDCRETARGFGGVAPPCDDDEIVLVFVFHTLLDCRLLKYGEFGARFDLGACLKSSGEVREGNEFLGAVVPRADAVLFQIGFHVVGRLGVKGCIESVESWLPQLAALAERAAAKFVMAANPAELSTNKEEIAGPTTARPYPHVQTNARMAACNAYMRDFARRGGGAWTYLGGQYEMSWLGEEWVFSVPHFQATPMLDVFARALVAKLADAPRPSRAPVAAPTPAPTAECADDAAWAYVGKDRKRYTCAWVADEPALRCRAELKGGAGRTPLSPLDACPGSCGTCPPGNSS